MLTSLSHLHRLRILDSCLISRWGAQLVILLFEIIVDIQEETRETKTPFLGEKKEINNFEKGLQATKQFPVYHCPSRWVPPLLSGSWPWAWMCGGKSSGKVGLGTLNPEGEMSYWAQGEEGGAEATEQARTHNLFSYFTAKTCEQFAISLCKVIWE